MRTFKFTFTTEDFSTPLMLPISTHPSLPKIIITEHGVFTLLSQVACGPDNIPACVLCELAQDLIPMISHLFKQSL